MRVLHVVKTSHGATWAAAQATVLAQLGVEVHVALPDLRGGAAATWQALASGVHLVDLSLPIGAPWRYRTQAAALRELLARVQPDLIHSHFVTTTLLLRLALGDDGPPRIFQVPGPLHLEHQLFRTLDLRTAGRRDFWVASSGAIDGLYAQAGVPATRRFLSYYGDRLTRHATHGHGTLRAAYGIADDRFIVGNINYMYPPKYYLGQFGGLKRHEDVIDALGLVTQRHPHVLGVLVGGQWGGGHAYEQRLHRRATARVGERVLFTGYVPGDRAPAFWDDFDCAVHVPISENCGGVVEPLLHGVPTIASRVGGLPEVVIDGLTGWLVPPRNPAALATAIEAVLADPGAAQQRAARGNRLVRMMFDVERTAREVHQLYAHLLGNGPAPLRFDAHAALREVA